MKVTAILATSWSD